jgi:hypothetical protein
MAQTNLAVSEVLYTQLIMARTLAITLAAMQAKSRLVPQISYMSATL